MVHQNLDKKKTLCENCQHRSTCTELCEEMERILCSGQRRQREKTNHEIENNEEVQVFSCDDDLSRGLYVIQIVDLHKRGYSVADIIYQLPYERQLVYKVIKQWHLKGKPKNSDGFWKK